jgi:hypothetical protein
VSRTSDGEAEAMIRDQERNALALRRAPNTILCFASFPWTPDRRCASGSPSRESAMGCPARSLSGVRTRYPNTSGLTAFSLFGWPSSTLRMLRQVAIAMRSIDSRVTPAMWGATTTFPNFSSG